MLPSVAFLRRGLLVAVLAYGLLLVDWGGARPPAPVVRGAFLVTAPIEAGAAAVRIGPPLPVVRAGYGSPRAIATTERDPLHARALVLRAGDRSLAFVLVDLVLVPDALSRRLEARLADLKVDAILLVATHTHSSVGGFDARLLAQTVGTGRYRADVAEAILGACERAVREARSRLVPVHQRSFRGRIEGWAGNRSTPDAPIDDALDVHVFESEAGARIATVAIVAAHPTLESRTTPVLSADYPGAAMRRLEEAGGIALVLQGAEGDAAVPGKGVEAIESAGAAVSTHVTQALAHARPVDPAMGFARVEVRLPHAEVQAMRPFLLRRPLSNLVRVLAPDTANVEAIRIGDAVLLAVPGEPTALAARELSQDRGRVLALADGYVGYVDTADRVRAGHGEARRAWFGPDLIEALRAGLQVAIEKIEPARAP